MESGSSKQERARGEVEERLLIDSNPSSRSAVWRSLRMLTRRPVEFFTERADSSEGVGLAKDLGMARVFFFFRRLARGEE